MAGTSNKTKAVALRLSNEVYEVLERRVARSNKWDKVSEYIKTRITSDALRKR